MSHYKVGYFVGNLSASSINRLLAKALVRLAPPELDLREISLRVSDPGSPTGARVS